MGQIKIKSAYSPRDRSEAIDTGPHSLTQQHFKDECDVNIIVKRFAESGVLTHTNPLEPQYGFATGQSFTEAMFHVMEANEHFESLPSAVRTHFHNQTAEYLDALGEPDRIEEFYSLGLIERPPEEKTPPAPPQEPSPTPLPESITVPTPQTITQSDTPS